MRFLIRNEFDKFFARKHNWFFIIFFSVLVIGSIILTYEDDDIMLPQKWKQEIEKEIISNNELINDIELAGTLKEELIKQNTVLSYALENDINITDKSVWKYTEAALPLIIVILIYIISLSSSIFQDEIRYKTINNLLLSPYSTRKIIISKILFLVLINIAYIVLMFGITFLSGTFLSEDFTVNLVNVEIVGDNIQERSLSFTIMLTYTFHAIELIIISILTVLISIIFNNKTLSLFLIIGVVLGAEQFNVPYIGNYLIISNLNYTKHLLQEGNIAVFVEVFKSSIINFSYLLAFLWLSIKFTNRREFS